MNYIYDVLTNFSEKGLFEFYEWNQTDNIEHLRKIPIFRINNIKLEKIFLNKIKNKTEIFTNTKIDTIEYCSIFTDGMDLIIIEFDEDGKSIKRSSMLLDEYEDTLDESDLLDTITIKYEILDIIDENKFLTRFQKEVYNYIEDELENLIEKKSYNKLKYLYYEWYNKKNNDMTDMIQKLLNILSMDFSSKHEKFFGLLKLSNMKKQL